MPARVLVVSDSHGDEWALRRALADEPDASVVIHLGDGVREAETLSAQYPDRTFYIVRGNCDFAASDYLPAREETVGGVRLFFTHGHLYGVKYDLYRIACAARERRAEVLLFGHTHEPLCDYDDGLYLVNPGSLHDGSYAVLDIRQKGLMPTIRRLRW